LGDVTRHHLVPQTYLRRFADGNGRIVMVGRDHPHQHVQTTVKTAVAANDFYRIDTADVADEFRDGHDPEMVEKALAGIEDVTTPLFDALVAGRFPDWEDRYRIAAFTALQHARGAGYRADMNRLGTLAMRTHLDATVSHDRVRDWLSEQGRPASDSDVAVFLDELLGERGPRLELSQAYAVQQSLRQAMELVLPRLYFASWQLFRFERPVLVTSDAPVVPWSPPRPDGLPVGVMDAAVVYLPLDRQTLLAVTDRSCDEVADVVLDGDAELAGRVNALVCDAAERWVLHHPDDSVAPLLPLPPRGQIVEETVGRTEDQDGAVRVQKRYVRRAVTNVGSP
jgi:hypothetical protein